MTYADVNGVNMYYEVHGSGRPLVLIHGALSAIGTSFGAVLPHLAKNRQVIAVELQAHGRTADVDRPLTVAGLASDVVALLRTLDVERADLFGYSLGAAVALHIAVTHPELVHRVVLASVSYHNGGLHPGLLDGIQLLQPEHLVGSPFHDEYLATAPRPEDFPGLVAKVKELDAELPEWPAGTVAAVEAPVMLVFGDSDIIRPEHAVELFRLLGGGVAGDMVGLPRARLAVLPGTAHTTVTQRADLLVPMVEDFLDAG
jgi:pimeloyl-ACP methyl ester carboxylesterase